MFLNGEKIKGQKELFFWAYNFEWLPIELLSSIYEDFYHSPISSSEFSKESGTYYTPTVLVDFCLNRTLTENRLKTNPRILDPACGSGIFLVQAFKRIVLYKQSKFNRKLNIKILR